MDALTPFQCPPKTTQDPSPFEHLRWNGKDDGAIDIVLKATLKSKLVDFAWNERPQIC